MGVAIAPPLPDATRDQTTSIVAAIPGGRWTAIDRDQFRAPADFAIHAMRLRQLVPMGGSFEKDDGARTVAAFVGYDGASGQLLRLRLVEKR